MKKVDVIILGAGRSKRLGLNQPKVVVELGGRPLVFYLLDTIFSLKNVINQVVFVVGFRKEMVKKIVRKNYPSLRFAEQKVLNGTAKAVEIGLSKCNKGGSVLILCGDAPLVKAFSLKKLIALHFKNDSDCSFITAFLEEENDLGRVLRDGEGKVEKIIEKINLRKKSREVNSGIYCFKKGVLKEALSQINMDKRKKEYFLTQVIEILYKKGAKISTYSLKDNREILGVNTLEDFSQVYKILNQRFIQNALKKGVKIIDPDTTFLSYDAKIGKNSIIYPFTFIEKNVIIGDNCVVGPFAHIRENTIIKKGAQIGNFAEINRSYIGEESKVKHFSYLGDAYLEKKVNIGAGTVTANYDGERKNKTYIGKEAFIGSDTILVAPLKIGKKALTGAGAVVTKNVKSNTIVVGVPARVLRKKR